MKGDSFVISSVSFKVSMEYLFTCWAKLFQFINKLLLQKFGFNKKIEKIESSKIILNLKIKVPQDTHLQSW